jgi:pyruvate dehydrogenase E1 component alpha subunit
MAALWKLPVIFIIENNGYAMGTAVHRHAAGRNLYERGEAYGIPGREVDGMDVVATHAAACEAVEEVRAGKGPLILEMKTYRYRGHSMSDPAKYRSKEEVEQVRENADPINHARLALEKDFQIGEEDFKIIDKEIKSIVNEAADFAQTSLEPDPSELYTDIIIEDSTHFSN